MSLALTVSDVAVAVVVPIQVLLDTEEEMVELAVAAELAAELAAFAEALLTLDKLAALLLLTAATLALLTLSRLAELALLTLAALLCLAAVAESMLPSIASIPTTRPAITKPMMMKIKAP